MYPRLLRSTRFLALIAASVAAASCSKPEKTPSLETAASVTGSQPMRMPASDSGSAAKAAETSTTGEATPTTPPAQPSRKSRDTATVRPSNQPAPEPAAAANATDSAVQPSTPAQASQDEWLSYDAATNTVTFELIAGPFTFNGYRNGEATLVVPPKANIVMNFVNKDGTPHSAIVISGEGPIPNSASDPAIPRAYTSKVLEGMPQEAGDVMRFPVPESGTYRIFCGVPGHGLSGMWIWMKIDPAAKTPSFGPTKG